MINKKEIFAFLIAGLIISVSVSFLENTEVFFHTLLAVFLILSINVLAKKIIGFHLESEIEIRLWEISRYGFRPKNRFKKPLPAGALFPIISKIILFPFKNLVWMASLIFEVKPKTYRAAKRHGFYSFSEMTESHIGLIAAAGIIANLFFSVAGYFFGFSDFARLSIYYAFFNMIPLSSLDGNKIFFGNLVVWSFLASIVLIGLFFAIFVI